MDRPNIVLLVLDAFRHDHLWRQTAQGPLCPQLADFAADATSFESAISPATHTVPSHASLFTGRLPCDHGVFSLAQICGRGLPAPDLASLLRQRGYVTVCQSANPYISPHTALGEGYDFTVPSDRLGQSRLAQAIWEVRRRATRLLGHDRRRPPWRAMIRGVEGSLADLEVALRLARQAWPQKPLFLFCNLMVTHDPYLFRPRDAAAVARGHSAGRRIRPVRIHDHWLLDFLGVEPITAAMIERLRLSYAAAVRYAGHVTDRLVKAVDRHWGREGTDVVVTSDHGELLGEHGSFTHDLFLYEPLVHVPLVVRSEALPRGHCASHAVQSHWAWSFILERAGLLDQVDVPPGQGSLLDAARGESAEVPLHSCLGPGCATERYRVALAVATSHGMAPERIRLKPLDAHAEAVRIGDTAVIRTQGGKRVAYRISGGCETELGGPEFEAACALAQSHFLLESAEMQEGPAQAVPQDPVLLARLRDLGYT